MQPTSATYIIGAILGVLGAAVSGWFGIRQSRIKTKVVEIEAKAEVTKAQVLGRAGEVRAILEANKQLIEALATSNKQLREEALQDRGRLDALQTKLDTCLTEKTHESIAFEKRIAKLEALVEAGEAQFKNVKKYENTKDSGTLNP